MDSRVQDYFNGLSGKRIALCGVGTSNFPLIKKFVKYGAKVTVCDKRSEEQLGDLVSKIKNDGAELHCGDDYLKNLDVDIVFRTPGMKFYLPELIDLKSRGVVVTSEMEEFFDLCPCKIIAVTGSDGKTTTTTIISEILKASGKTVHLGGNIGHPLLPEVDTINKDDIAIVELSSFQLISMRKSPQIAVVTNLSPNHLDIHKDMEEYTSAKMNIFMHQNAYGRLVLNDDNNITRAFKPLARGESVMFSREKELYNGVWVNNDGMIIVSANGNNTAVMHKNDIKLLGNHNLENYLAAIGAVFGLVDNSCIVKVAKEFGGVEHRTELVRTINGVSYYNDSIASSPTRTIKGTLSLYDRRIIMIAGGYDKKIPFDELGNAIVEKVKLLILLGSTADKIEEAVLNAKNYSKGNPEICKVENMEQAVLTAQKKAISGDIVSLSPACASFGLYKDFNERGRHFKSIVNSL